MTTNQQGVWLEPAIDDLPRQDALHVIDDAVLLQEGAHVQRLEFLVGDGEDDGVEPVLRILGGHFDAVFAADGVLVRPGVIDRDVVRVFLQGVVDVHDLGVADVRAVLLEGDSEDENLRVLYHHALLVHALDGLVRHVGAHAVVEPAGIGHHAGEHTVHLRFLDEVIRVHGDAVAAHEAGTELDEVPLGGGRFDDVMGVEAHGVENLGELVHESDVHVALRVLDDLGRFRDLDGRGLVRAARENGVIDTVHEVGDFRRGTGRDLLDLLHGMELVTGVDALGGVAGEEIHVELQAGNALHHGEALLLRDAGVHRGLIDHDIALADDLAHRLGCPPERLQVRVVVLVHGRGDGDDVEIAVPDLVQVRRTGESVLVDGFLQQFVRHLQGGVVPAHERIHALPVHVKADGFITGGEKPCQRQSHITQSDDANLDVVHSGRKDTQFL